MNNVDAKSPRSSSERWQAPGSTAKRPPDPQDKKTTQHTGNQHGSRPNSSL
jgi:hypothetical protein